MDYQTLICGVCLQMVIWIVGLSGSGKTTTGKEIHRLWKPQAPNTVMVDGDDVRRILGHDTKPYNYTIEGRLQNAKRIVEVCKWLDNQDINVICCILCIFKDVMNQNRNIFSSYYEVFLEAPIELLKKRDPKGLYKKAAEGRENNVVGIDIPFEPPQNPDLTILNSESMITPAEIAESVLVKAGVINGC